jgi:hypothetical protein
MTEIATRLQVGIAASAMAVAATLVPMAAQAAPNISMPTAPVTQVLQVLPEFNWFYFGPDPNTGTVPGIPAGPTTGFITLFSFNVPSLVTFWTNIGLINQQICFAGSGLTVNEYGGLTLRFNAAGC